MCVVCGSIRLVGSCIQQLAVLRLAAQLRGRVHWTDHVRVARGELCREQRGGHRRPSSRLRWVDTELHIQAVELNVVGLEWEPPTRVRSSGSGCDVDTGQSKAICVWTDQQHTFGVVLVVIVAVLVLGLEQSDGEYSTFPWVYVKAEVHPTAE